VNDPQMQRVDESEVDAINARLERDIAYFTASNQHMWTVAQVHALSDAAARKVANGTADDGDLIMDKESLRSVTFGCYLCESPLNPRLIGKRCPGKPLFL
jgi:hypothetical protein